MRQGHLLLVALILGLAGCLAAPYQKFSIKDNVGYFSYSETNGFSNSPLLYGTKLAGT